MNQQRAEAYRKERAKRAGTIGDVEKSNKDFQKAGKDYQHKRFHTRSPLGAIGSADLFPTQKKPGWRGKLPWSSPVPGKDSQTLEEFKGSRFADDVFTHVNYELQPLGQYLEDACEGVQWIPGPNKGIDRLEEKTRLDYLFNYGKNKDLVRGTVACNSMQEMMRAASAICNICHEKYGLGLREIKVRATNKMSHL